uniref:F-box protein At2g23160-like n=1 Tax=Erigeron canadensis TaxID=72917 RepID=UPI001CB8C32B|nr:F-box protein At2g23160-like [Erigeron canadensis]
MADLPKDALYDILSRLPVESLARFRCVCKPWCNYIDDPYLVSIHVNEPILMMLNGECATLPKRPGIVSIIESKEGNTVFEVKQDPIYRFKSKGSQIQDIGISNGMILLAQDDDEFLDDVSFLVIHPLRKERYELPFLDLQFPLSCPNAYGLGFDDSTKTFKVVFLFTRLTSQLDNLCTMVHILGTYLWRKIPQIPECYKMYGQGVFVKGLLHWVNASSENEHTDMCKLTYFDVRKEEFGVIDPPPKPTISTMDQLVNINDKLGYAYKIDDSVQVWILKHKEWLSYGQFHCAPLLSCSYDISLRGLGCCNQDGDLLIRAGKYHDPGRFFIYKLESGDLHEVNINGLEYNSKIILYQSHLSSTIHYINKMPLPATKIDLIKATSTRTFLKGFFSLKMLFTSTLLECFDF